VISIKDNENVTAFPWVSTYCDSDTSYAAYCLRELGRPELRVDLADATVVTCGSIGINFTNVDPTTTNGTSSTSGSAVGTVIQHTCLTPSQFSVETHELNVE